MDMRAVQIFASLEGHTTLSDAAERNFISRQGLSKSIASLEAELGAPLLQRGRSGFRFTQFGRTFLKHAKTITAEYDAARNAIFHEHFALQENGRLDVIGTPYIFESAIDSALVSRVISYANISTMPFHDLLDAIRTSDANALFVAEVFPKTVKELESTGIEPLPFFHAVPGVLWGEESRMPNTDLATPQDLAGMPLVVNSSKTAQRCFEQVAKRAGQLDVRARLGRWSTLVDAVRTENVVALFDSFQLKCLTYGNDDVMGELRFTPFSDKDMHFNLCMLKREGIDLSPACMRFFNRVQTIFS